MADDKTIDIGVNIGSQPSPGIGSSELKVMAAASALTAVAGAFHKQLDMDQAVKFVDGLAALYVVGRSGVKMAHALASAVMAWAMANKATPKLPPFPFPMPGPRPAAPPPPPPSVAPPVP